MIATEPPPHRVCNAQSTTSTVNPPMTSIATTTTTVQTTTTPPPTISSAAPHSQAFRWALRSRRKKESITLQKLWKIKRALSLAATTTDIDPRADISLGLARAACVASYNDLLGATTTAIERRTHAIQQEIQSLYPVEPFYVQYLHFIETSIPVIEQTRLGKAALSYVLDHVDIEETGLWLEFGVSKGTTLSRIAQRAAAGRLHCCGQQGGPACSTYYLRTLFATADADRQIFLQRQTTAPACSCLQHELHFFTLS